MIKTNDPLIPPFRFAIVEEGLLRGSYPTDRNFRFLKRFKLKTIVSLTPKPPTKSFYTFCEQNNTIGKHFTVSKFKDDVTLSASQVVQLLEMMIEPNNLPMYIHCLDGANVTGTIFMCLRKLQNWNLSSIIQEFTRFTRGGTIASSEAEFVETFKAEIDVSPQIPPWLWQGIRMIKHPTLKLRLVGGDQQPTLLALNQDHSSLNLLNTPIISSVTSNNNTSSTNSLPTTTNTTPNRSQLTSTIVDDGGNLLQKLIELNLNNNTNNNIQNNNSNIQNDNQTIVNNNNNNNNNIQNIEENIEKQDKTLKTSSESDSGSNIEKTTAAGEKKKNIDVIIENVTVTSSTTTTNIVQQPQIQQPTLPQSNTPNISSVLTQSPRILSTISPLSASGIITGGSGKDKKKKVEDIKIQFDSGKFMTLTESRSLEALSLERSSKPSLSSQSQQSNNSSSNNNNNNNNQSNNLNTTTSQHSPNSRHALFLSSNPNDK